MRVLHETRRNKRNKEERIRDLTKKIWGPLENREEQFRWRKNVRANKKMLDSINTKINGQFFRPCNKGEHSRLITQILADIKVKPETTGY